MHKLFVALVFLASAAFPRAAQEPAQDAAPSSGNRSEIPCDQRQTQLDMNECSAALYKKSDGQLNALYSKLVQHFQAGISRAEKEKDAVQRDYEQRGLSSLRQAQRAWIQYRDAHCAAARQRYEGGTIVPLMFSQCMTEVTDHRVEELKHTYDSDEGE